MYIAFNPNECKDQLKSISEEHKADRNASKQNEGQKKNLMKRIFVVTGIYIDKEVDRQLLEAMEDIIERGKS